MYLVETFPRRQQNLSSETLNLRIEDSRDEKTDALAYKETFRVVKITLTDEHRKTHKEAIF